MIYVLSNARGEKNGRGETKRKRKGEYHERGGGRAFTFDSHAVIIFSRWPEREATTAALLSTTWRKFWNPLDESSAGVLLSRESASVVCSTNTRRECILIRIGRAASSPPPPLFTFSSFFSFFIATDNPPPRSSKTGEPVVDDRHVRDD